MRSRRALATAGFVTLAALAVYLGSFRTIVSVDASTNVVFSYSIVRDGDVWLDEFSETYSRLSFWYYDVGAHRVSWYPPGAGYLAVPIVAVANAIGIAPPATASVTIVGKVAAALATALSVGVVCLIATRICGRQRGITVAALYAFGTASWPTSGGGLWQHGPAQLFIALGLHASLLTSASSPRAGLAFGLASTTRITDAAFWLAGLAGTGGRVKYLAWSVGPAILLATYNLAAFGSVLSPYFTARDVGNPLVGMAGNLISPSRGLFAFSPFLLLAVVGLWHASRGFGRIAIVVRWQSAAALATLAVYASYADWPGGHSYGNRYLADTLPLLAVGLAVWMRRYRSPRAWALLGALATPSIAIAAVGALLYDWIEWSWESLPVPVAELMWRVDLAQPWWTMTHAGARFDILTWLSLGMASVVMAALVAVMLRAAPYRGAVRRVRPSTPR